MNCLQLNIYNNFTLFLCQDATYETILTFPDDIRAVNGFDSIVSIIGIIFSFEISIDVIIGFLQFRTPLGIMMFYN